jgi:hypothetical protein
MITFLTVAGIMAYLFFGVVMSFVLEDTDDSTSIVLCLMAWPLVVLVMAGMWVGDKIRSKMNK